MQTNHSAVRICFLVSLFHVMVVVCCFVFQQVEYHHSKKSSYANYADFVDSFRRNGSERLAVAQLKKLLHLEEQRTIREKFNNLENAYMFTLTSFAALGNSGLRPIDWKGKLFYSLITPLGFSIYVFVIVSLAYHFRDFVVFTITKIENRKPDEINFLSTKVLLASLAVCVCIAQIGGVISAISGNGYFNGVYIAIDTMTFTGNESIAKGETQLGLLFLLSFYFMFLHAFVLVVLCYLQQTWDEITSSWSGAKSTCFYQEFGFSPEHNYRYKLLAAFDSPSSTTPISDENEAESDVCFPQLWSLQYDSEPEPVDEPLMLGQTERKDGRFTEIFHAQRALFEPIIETAEYQEEELSDSSSYKSSNDFFITTGSSLKTEN